MGRKYERVVKRDGTRRRALPWDRLKIGLLLVFILLVGFSNTVNGPFTTPSEALRETWSSQWWLFALLGLEVLRQVHYLVAERSARYNQFWTDSFFGGMERRLQSWISPWTRFRLGRYVKLAIFFLLVGMAIDYFVDDVSSPVTALVQAPRILARNLEQFIIFLFLPLVLIGQFAALFWFLSRGGVTVTQADEIEKRYTDVWGQDHVLDMVKENVGFLEKPEEIEAKGGHVPGGLLLWGPPGTGKTLIAEATAGETGVPFVSVEPSAFINMFIGVGPLKVKGLFRKLRKLSLRHGGVVAFFDEADSLGNRGNLAGQGVGQPMEIPHDAMTCNGFGYLSGHAQNDIAHLLGWGAKPAEEDNQRTPIHKIVMGGMGGGGGGMGTLQVLLSELSGLSKPRGITNRLRKALGMKPKPPPKYRIFIMMASNLPEALDPALLRPGRLDRIYRVGYPNKEGRVKTFEGYLNKVDHELSDEQIEDLAVKTPYYSGAKIKDIVNEALIIAIRDDRQAVTYDDIWKAKVHKELGPSDNTDYIDRERHAVAVHEACHAVVAHLTSTRNTIDLATIERHQNALGMVVPIQLEDRATRWRTEFEADVMVSLASLAGEKMFFEGDNSSGVSADLRNATAQASYMMGLYGMGDTLSSLAAMGQARFGTPDPSPDILRRMGPKVEGLLQELYDRTEELLEEYREKVLAVAAALEERKTISGDDIAEIMGTEPGVLAKDREGTWMRIDPNRALLASGNGEGSAEDPEPAETNGEVGEEVAEEPDEELDPV
jgi:cell division protease FtsH